MPRGEPGDTCNAMAHVSRISALPDLWGNVNFSLCGKCLKLFLKRLNVGMLQNRMHSF